METKITWMHGRGLEPHGLELHALQDLVPLIVRVELDPEQLVFEAGADGDGRRVDEVAVAGGDGVGVDVHDADVGLAAVDGDLARGEVHGDGERCVFEQGGEDELVIPAVSTL